MCQQAKARQYSTPSDTNSPPLYPEYIVSYLVHAFAHNSSFPNPDECKDIKAYESIYRYIWFPFLFQFQLCNPKEVRD